MYAGRRGRELADIVYDRLRFVVKDRGARTGHQLDGRDLAIGVKADLEPGRALLAPDLRGAGIILVPGDRACDRGLPVAGGFRRLRSRGSRQRSQ